MPHLSTGDRVGRDGRRYSSGEPLAVRRGMARELLRDHAELSDRELGRRAGLSAAVRRLRDEPPRSARTPGRRRGVARVVAGLLRSTRSVVGRAAALLGRLLRRR